METNNGSKATETKRRQRSPQHPAFSLREAISKAQTLYDKEGATMVGVSVACEHWGYTLSSSSGLRCIATMADFGLVEIQGTGDARRVGVSALGRRLVRHPDKSSEEYQAALRGAALAPKIHQELHEAFPTGLPSDEALSWDLEEKWGFNTSSIGPFIAEVRDTFSLAKLEESNRIPEEEGEKVLIPHGDRIDPRSRAQIRLPNSGAPGMKQEVFTLAEGDVVLQWPSRLSPESYQDFKDWLDLIARKVARAVREDDPNESDPEPEVA